MAVVWIAIRQSPTSFLVGDAGGRGVFLLGSQCPAKPQGSGETWTSRDVHLGCVSQILGVQSFFNSLLYFE